MTAEPLKTANEVLTLKGTRTVPKKWVSESSTVVTGYAELMSDTRAMEAEIERYASKPVEGFTRLDDFLAETD